MAVITTLIKGFDADYPFKQQGRWSGDYFDVKGEPLGRWRGTGAAALGLALGCLGCSLIGKGGRHRQGRLLAKRGV